MVKMTFAWNCPIGIDKLKLYKHLFLLFYSSDTDLPCIIINQSSFFI